MLLYEFKFPESEVTQNIFIIDTWFFYTARCNEITDSNFRRYSEMKILIQMSVS